MALASKKKILLKNNFFSNAGKITVNFGIGVSLSLKTVKPHRNINGDKFTPF